MILKFETRSMCYFSGEVYSKNVFYRNAVIIHLVLFQMIKFLTCKKHCATCTCTWNVRVARSHVFIMFHEVYSKDVFFIYRNAVIWNTVSVITFIDQTRKNHYLRYMYFSCVKLKGDSDENRSKWYSRGKYYIFMNL